MNASAKINLTINRGASFLQQFRWESDIKEYIPIDYIYKSAPVRIVVNDATKLPPLGWRIRITDVVGMRQINMEEDVYEILSTIDNDEITITNINSLNYYDFQYGGVVTFNKPVDLIGIRGRMQIRQSINDSEPIYTLTSENGSIVFDNDYKSIMLHLLPHETANMDFTTGVYDLEFIYNNNDVYRFAEGSITLKK